MLVATHWPKLSLYLSIIDLEINDLVAHTVAYAIWAGLWYWVLMGHRPVRWRTFVGLFILGTIYAVFDEWTQALVARSPAFSDLIANMLGIVIGSAGAHLVFKRLRRLR